MIETNDIAELKTLLVSLQADKQRLHTGNAEISQGLIQNSTNFRKPPALDCLAKKTIQPALLNNKSQKKGEQCGHPGHTLLMNPTPDTFIEHRPNHNQQYGEDLIRFSLPQPGPFIEEPTQMSILCDYGCINAGKFTAWESAPVQYDLSIQSQSNPLTIDYKLLFAKVTQFRDDLRGQSYNLAALTKAQAILYEQVEPLEIQIKQQLQAAQLCYFDETGVHIGGKLQWLCITLNAFFSYLFVHPSRSQKALKSTQSVFEGCFKWLVHDRSAARCWSSYCVASKGHHALCGTQLLREIQVQIERGRQWTKHLSEDLLSLYQSSRHGALPANEERRLQQPYWQLCGQGLANGLPPMIFYNKAG